MAKKLPLKALAGNVCIVFLKNTFQDSALVNLHSLKCMKNFVRGPVCLVLEAVIGQRSPSQPEPLQRQSKPPDDP